MISTTYPCLHLERFDRFPLCFPILFAIGSRRRGGALKLGDRGHRELCGPAEVMRVKDSLNVLERVPRDGRDFGHLAPGLVNLRPLTVGGFLAVPTTKVLAIARLLTPLTP